MTNTDPIVLIETAKGKIKCQIFQNDAPITAANFLDLVNRGFYNGLIFHRYEPGFCLQGGDPDGTGRGGSGKTIPLEVKPHLKHDEAGIMSMARTNDPNSATSQFFFTLGNASFLNMQYAVFGKVIEGLDIMMSLRAGDKMDSVSVMNAVPNA